MTKRITINLSRLRAVDFWISSSGRAVAEFEDENGDEILFEVDKDDNGNAMTEIVNQIDRLFAKSNIQ